MSRILILAVVIIVVAITPCIASLSPQEVLVVYNNSTEATGYDWSISKTVADYYCDQRGIPTTNQVGVFWPYSTDSISPTDFINRIATPLKSFLISRGSDPNSPGTDPIKCIVLCYGVPSKMYGWERVASVDSSLSLLFNTTPWGKEPIGTYCTSADNVANPYYNPQGSSSSDFDGFRTSSSNSVPETAPHFTIVRMLDATHAFAAGEKGILYKGVLVNGTWSWIAVVDKDKGFIVHDVNDIYVLNPQRAWISTAHSVIRINTTDQTWQMLASNGMPYAYIGGTPRTSSSFYDDNNGWRVGSYQDTKYSCLRYFIDRIAYGMSTRMWDSKNPSQNGIPAAFVPHSVAAGASQVWVSGVGGIHFTSDGGSTWNSQYSGDTSDIWVRNNVGWAITLDGHILHWDGSSWQQVTAVQLTSDQAAKADLAVYDADHLTIAYGESSFLCYNSGTWSTDSSDSAIKCSVAWAGDGTNPIAVSGTDTLVRMKQDDTVWNTTPAIPDMNWKMRYLVCRLDGYSDPIDTETGIPSDIKNMIDKSVAANGLGRSSYQNAKFILDGPHQKGCTYDSSLVSLLSAQVGSDNCIHDETSTWLNSDQSITGDVVGYSSTGSYHYPNALATTRWWRPVNINLANNGAGTIGMYKCVSGDAASIRTPNFTSGTTLDTEPTHIEAGKLKVHLWTVTSDPNNLYTTHRIDLRSASGVLLASAPFDRTETISRVIDENTTYTWTVRTAVLDLSTINWNGNVNTYIEFRLPSDDPLLPNGVIYKGSTTSQIYDARTTGISYYVNVNQCLASELIRYGCAATAGNVIEPFADGCPVPEVIFRQYAAGYSWAESAYMGLPYLSWMEVAIGDPLMAPYEVHPTAAFEPPTPNDGDKVRGPVSLKATATPDGNGTIQRIDFWVTNTNQVSSLIGSDSEAPYECTWDTLQTSSGSRVYPNGNYTIKAVAYESGNAIGSATVTRSATVDDTIPTISITNPQTESSVVGSTTPLQVQVSTSVNKVQYWLLGNGNPILVGEVSSPYQCYIPASVTDGEYQLQAVAVNHTNSPYLSSYSAKRTIRVVDNVASGSGSISNYTNGTIVYLAGTPVTAGSSPTIDYPLTTGHAFYLEDNNRCAGIRVVSANPVATGRSVSVLGVLHADSGVSERYIEATQVWDEGTAAVMPTPVGMSNLWLGGKDTDNVGGQPNPGLGNVGMLARIWGKVTYVGSNFAYIDDGSHIQDGNSLGAVGVRVYFADVLLPSVGSYLNITGISSVEMIGNYRERMLRVMPVSSSASYSGKVTYVGSDSVYIDDGTHPWDGNEIPAPRIVPQDGSAIPSAEIGVKGRKVYFGSLIKPGIDDEVSVTGQSYYSYIDDRPVPMSVSSLSDVTYLERYIPARSASSGIVTLDGKTLLPVGTKVRLVDNSITVTMSNRFLALPPSQYLPIVVSIPAATSLQSEDTVTITGVVMNRTAENWLQVNPSAGHIYFGGSAYGAASMSGTVAMSLSSASVSSDSDTTIKVRGDDGRSGGGPFRPWPGPTVEEILASPWFQEHYYQEGAMGWALSQPDGTVIDLLGEEVICDWYNGSVLGLKEAFEPGVGLPKLLLYLDKPVSGLGDRMCSIDIIGGTLITLSNGQRAIVKPKAVYAYTDTKGRYMFTLPWFKWIHCPSSRLDGLSLVESSESSTKSLDDLFNMWPWKVQIAP